MDFQINYMAVLAATVVNIGIGFSWYGPLFGKTWMKLIGKTKKELDEESRDKMPMLFGSMIVTAFLMNFVLAHFIQTGLHFMGVAGAGSLTDGMMIAGWAWLGFVAATSLGGFTWSGRSLKLYALENANHLVNFLTSGAILAVLR